MSIYIYIQIYIYTYIYICARVCVCVHLSQYQPTYPYIYIYTYIYICACVCVNYSDITVTSLESWLARRIIPKWPNISCEWNIFVFPIHTHIYIYIFMCVLACVCVIGGSGKHPDVTIWVLFFLSLKKCLFSWPLCPSKAHVQRLGVYFGLKGLKGGQIQGESVGVLNG